jgi:hypothetical protein
MGGVGSFFAVRNINLIINVIYKQVSEKDLDFFLDSCFHGNDSDELVIPAKAGIHSFAEIKHHIGINFVS